MTAEPPAGAGKSSAGVAIFATGGYEPDATRLARTRRYFEDRGRDVVIHFDPAASHQRFAGTDDDRLRSLLSTIDDEGIDLAIAQRGGYGATRLLPHIPFERLRGAVDRGTRFVGHSDFTAISLGLLATTGATSFAGPMASFGFGGETVDPFTETHFWHAMDESRVTCDFATPHAGALDAAGLLWGGNLSMIASLVGTPWMPVIDGGILFVEDVNEQPYRVERMLLQLLQAGILQRQRLVLCGDVNGYRVADYDRDYDLAAALARVQAETTVPIVAGLPFGHSPRKLTLAVGVPARVDVADGNCRLRQDWSNA